MQWQVHIRLYHHFHTGPDIFSAIYWSEYMGKVWMMCSLWDGTVSLYIAFVWSYLGSSNSTETSLETHKSFLVFFILGFIFHPLNVAQLSSAQMSCQTLLFFSLFLESSFFFVSVLFFFFSFQSVVQPFWKMTKIDSQQLQYKSVATRAVRVYTEALVQLVLLLSSF